jgi:hypothetical protein
MEVKGLVSCSERLLRWLKKLSSEVLLQDQGKHLLVFSFSVVIGDGFRRGPADRACSVFPQDRIAFCFFL